MTPAHQPWSARVLAAVLLLTSMLGLVGEPRPQSAGFGVANPPDSLLGVHTRLSEEVESWKIEKTLHMTRAMGASWDVELFPWAYIEPKAGQFDWQHPDEVIRDANADGLTVVARLDYVPAWARPKGSTARRLDPAHYADYVRFVSAFAERYRGAVKYFIIWNEPNTSFEWGEQTVNARAYVQLLKLASVAIHKIDPTDKVLAAGLAPTIEHSDQALEDLTYLQQMYDAGARPYFDLMAVHAYGWTAPPDSPAASDQLNFARVELIHQVMAKNGDARKPILITESGWNDSPRWTKAVHPGQRIAYTLRALDLAKAQWPWVVGVCLWVFRLPAPSHSYDDYYTLVDFYFRPRPIYRAIQKRAADWRYQGAAG